MLDFYRGLGINLDLALEAREILKGETGREIPGVKVDEETHRYAKVNIVKIMEKYAENLMGKPVGTYVTIESPSIRENDPLAHQEIKGIISRHIKNITEPLHRDHILLVGLGNWHITPDSLGPRVMDNSIVTRHLFKHAPNELRDGMQMVSAIAPGVLGITGIETAEIIKGVVEKISPALIIVIDSLAARNMNRIGTTVQIADTGINPGSGIGNQRAGINFDSMGIPVIAIGVPTVLHAATVVKDTADRMIFRMKATLPLHNQSLIDGESADQVVEEMLEPFGGNLMVTPREIDCLIRNAAKIIAGGLSMFMHPGLKPSEYTYFM